jgi:putative transcriptional regulator
MSDTVKINDDYAVTGSVEALRAFFEEKDTPPPHIFALGYAGWDAGQLEQELTENSWLVSDVTEDLIFDVEPDKKWNCALAHMGVDPSKLSSSYGIA